MKSTPELIFIEISRDMIERQDPTWATQTIIDCQKRMPHDFRFTYVFEGYEDDPREIWQIPELVSFFEKWVVALWRRGVIPSSVIKIRNNRVAKLYPGISQWINRYFESENRSNWIFFVMLAALNPRVEGGRLTIKATFVCVGDNKNPLRIALQVEPAPS